MAMSTSDGDLATGEDQVRALGLGAGTDDAGEARGVEPRSRCVRFVSASIQ